MASPITTHVLDTHLGKPAKDLPVTLQKLKDGAWQTIAAGKTNSDGRIVDWLEGKSRESGHYKITFDTDSYFNTLGITCFYPKVSIEFRIENIDEHYHVPLLISAHGMSSYRGS